MQYMNSHKKRLQARYPSLLERPADKLPTASELVYTPVLDDGEFDSAKVGREGVVCLSQFGNLSPSQRIAVAERLGDRAVKAVFYICLDGDDVFEGTLNRILQQTGRRYDINVHPDDKVKNPEDAPASVVYNHFTLSPTTERTDEEPEQNIDTFIGVLKSVAEDTGDVLVRRGDELSDEEKDQLAVVQRAAFIDFVENHPGNQVESDEEFVAALNETSTVMMCHKGEDGKIDGYMYFSTEVLPWLNREYYEQLPKENRLFFTSIGSMQPDGGLGVAGSLMKVYAAAINKGTSCHNLYFQCTNRSNEYVGPIIRHYAEEFGVGVESEELARVYYRSVEFRD